MQKTIRRKVEPEEYEQHMVAREVKRQNQADFHVVERVIGTREGEDETEYYVKCKSSEFLIIYTS
jgi:chromodomain-helicase-DNA-binding protein 1